jgi:ribosomal protein L16/L10AE
MGKGKGAAEYWVGAVLGRIFEVSVVPLSNTRAWLKLSSKARSSL